MLRRVVIGAAFVCLFGAAAFGQDDAPATMEQPIEPAAPAAADGAPPEEGPVSECERQLTAAEEAVEAKNDAQQISEEEYYKVNELLDQADAQCDEGNLNDATATLATVNSMLAK